MCFNFDKISFSKGDTIVTTSEDVMSSEDEDKIVEPERDFHRSIIDTSQLRYRNLSRSEEHYSGRP